MKRTHKKPDNGPERPERNSSIPPLSEPPQGDFRKFSDAKLFEYAFEFLKLKAATRASMLEELKPELHGAIRARGLMDLLTHSLNVVTMDHIEVEAQISEVFSRQLISSSPDEIKKLVSLIPALYTLPDFQHVKDKAQLAGIMLTDDEVRKMCWVIRGYINYMDSKDGSP